LKDLKYDVKTTVLRKNVDEDEAMEIIEQKKILPFRSILSRPKKEQIHTHSIKLYYECVLAVSGKYVADYYRKATHTISVEHNVRDVVLGGGIFPAREKSGLAKSLAGRRGKNKIDMKLEEHVFIEEEDELFFDHHGREIRPAFKINSNTVENYPRKILEQNSQNVKKPEITNDAALNKLQLRLKKPSETEVRDLSAEFILRGITEIYVPVFEAMLMGPKKKIGVIRIDSARKKVVIG